MASFQAKAATKPKAAVDSVNICSKSSRLKLLCSAGVISSEFFLRRFVFAIKVLSHRVQHGSTLMVDKKGWKGLKSL